MNTTTQFAENFKSRFNARLIGPYQTQGVRWMLDREMSDVMPKGGLLADEMGLGKTVQMLAVIAANPSPDQPTLIVCPKSILGQWVDACERFLKIKPLLVTASEATSMDIKLLSHNSVIIAPYSAIAKTHPTEHNRLAIFQYHRVVLDEAHIIKKESSKIHRVCRELVASIRWALTGTPVTRRKRDFMAILRFVGITTGKPEQIREIFTLRRTLEDVAATSQRLALPPIEIRTHVVPFATPQERDLYNDLKGEGKMRLDAATSIGFTHDNGLGHIIEVITRLRQATTNPQLVFDGRKMELAWGSSITKVEELVKLIAAQPKHSKALVFVHWNGEAKHLKQQLEDRLELKVCRLYGAMDSKEREHVVDEFMNGDTQVMISQIDAGGVGLNLQAATHVYINSLHWNASNELQAIGRAHRTGVGHKVVRTLFSLRILDQPTHPLFSFISCVFAGGDSAHY